VETQDILIASVYFVFFMLGGVVIQVIKARDSRYRYFLPALSLKLIGGLSFALIYKYYYGYGDTFAYYLNSLNLTELLLENPKRGFEILMYFKNDVGAEVAGDLGGLNRIINSQNTFLVVKISALVNILSFSNFFGSTLIFSVLSFAGMWVGYLSLSNYFRSERLSFYASIAFFFIPSIFFWGSGLMKDSLVIGFLGLMIYGLIPIGNLKWPQLHKILILAISGYVIFVLKAYVLFCLFPALAYWIYLKSRSSMRNVVIRNVIAPLFLVGLFVGVILSVSLLGEFTEKYRIDQAFKTAKIYQDYHYTSETTDGRGSSYNLPDYGGDFANAILNIPAAIIVTLYRPYPWEVNSIVVFFAALESLILLIWTIRLLFKKGLKRIWNYLKTEPIMMFILTFTLLFSYVIGFSSYNFGALVRYKIQCMPLFIFMILALNLLIPNKKGSRRKAVPGRS
jgi:hypothetical protein